MKNKFTRDLSFHETAKILGTSNVKLLKLLRGEKVLFKQRNRNLPYHKYIKKGWFNIIETKVENNTFEAILPIVRITSKGFEEIKEMVHDNYKIVDKYNRITFWFMLFHRFNERLQELGIDLSKREVEEFYKKQCITFKKHNSSRHTIFTYINGDKVNLITYDTIKKSIIKNGGK